jgi:predicted TPR repeat methyltransferase
VNADSNDGSSDKSARMAGADAISAKAIAIAAEQDVLIAECVWDIGTDFAHEHAHRLDLITATKTVRLYFRDRELTMAANDSCAKRIDDRLRRAIAQLHSRTPAQTYTFR